METIQGNCLSSDRPLGKKGARNCLQRAFNRVSIGEEETLPLAWVVPVFVEIIHQIPDGEQCWEVGRKEPVCRNCVQKLCAEQAVYTGCGCHLPFCTLQPLPWFHLGVRC